MPVRPDPTLGPGVYLWLGPADPLGSDNGATFLRSILESSPAEAVAAVASAKVARRDGRLWRSLAGHILTWVEECPKGALWGLVGEGLARGGAPSVEAAVGAAGNHLADQDWTLVVGS